MVILLKRLRSEDCGWKLRLYWKGKFLKGLLLISICEILVRDLECFGGFLENLVLVFRIFRNLLFVF